MATVLKHAIDTGQKPGLKARATQLLKDRAASTDPAIATTGLTLGEIGAALGLPKTDHGALNSAMVKLRGEGKVRAESGPATSALGPRFVKRYLWKVRKPAPTPPPPSDDRRFLSLMR